LGTGSQRQADRRPQPWPRKRRRHERYRGPVFTPVRRLRRGYLGLTGVSRRWRSALERARVWDLYEMARDPAL